MKSRFFTWKYWWTEWIKPLCVAIILAMLIRTFIAQPFKIPSTSMYPTLKVGDRIFVNKFLYGARIPFTCIKTPEVRKPQRGDIIVFVSVTDSKYPEPQGEFIRILGPVFFNKDTKRLKWYSPRYIVKRLVGLPGDRLEIRDEDVYIDGKVLNEPFVVKKFSYYNAGDYGASGKTIEVPAGSYSVMGDNSANSVDSRFWGFVPEQNVTGKVFVIWWPLNRIRLVK
ncbi:MAG: signal peptidase I [Candidatus Omnitrophica bacterium]|nr:signal peptidase I [Candidatus Omnitrophota bacterium]